MTFAGRRTNTAQLLLDRFRDRFTAHCDTISALTGWPRRILALLLGVASVLAVAPIFAWPVLLATLPALALLLNEPKQAEQTLSFGALRRAAATGWWFGFGYFVAGLHWIVEPFLVEAATFAWLIPFAITLLPAGLALFYALAAVIARLVWAPGWASACSLAAAFGIAEWLRASILTGFPWNPLGHSLTGNDITLQWVSLTGTNALNVLAVAIFSLPLLLVVDLITRRLTIRAFSMSLLGVLAVLAAGVYYGTERLALSSDTHAGLKLRLVQPAIAQEEKWKPENQRKIFNKLLDLSRRNDNGTIDNLAGTTHVIWPESAIPFLLLRTPEALKEIAELLPDSTKLMTGALRINAAGNTASGERQVFNSFLAFDSEARLIGQYDKQHLVPFGEYLPLQSVLEAVGLQQLTRLRGGFTAGTGERFMSLDGTPSFVPLICYEVIFSGDVVVTTKRPEWMLVVTNDAWFGAGAGPRQHFHQARVRAVEEGLPLIRVSNNGISAVIDGNGRVAASLELNASGVIDAELPRALPPTVFVRLDVVPFLLCLAMFGGIAISRRHSGER